MANEQPGNNQPANEQPAATAADAAKKTEESGPAANAAKDQVESLLNVPAAPAAPTDKGVEGDGKDGADGVKKPDASPPKPLTAEDLTLPKGKSYDEELGKSFLDLINDAAIPRSELAQKLLDMYNAQQDRTIQGQQAAEEATEQLLQRRHAEWLEECKKDPEFGGQNYEASKAVITRGCTHLATEEAVNVLKDIGLGNHPEIVRMFYRAGKLIGEDPGAGKGKTAAGGKKEDALVAMHRKILEGE